MSENSGQFKEGESGNPNGAPEYWSRMGTILQRLSNLSPEDFDNYKCKNMKEKMVYEMLIKEDYKEVFDRIDGKAKQTIEQTGSMNNTLSFKDIKPDDGSNDG